MERVWKKPLLPIITAIGRRKEKSQFTGAPILIGGCARSGTTLLLSILSAHKDIFACPKELGLFNELKYDRYGNIYPKRIDRLYRTLLTNKIPKSAKRWCEKSPSNIHHVIDIENYFHKKMKFIQIIRDGRDVILSKHPKNPKEYWVSPERWIRDVSAGKQFIFYPKICTIKYEELILEFEKTTCRICDFLEIEATSEILNWHRNTTVTKNNAYFGKVKQLSSKSIGKWKHPEYRKRVEELTCIPEARELLSFYNYN